MDAMNAHYNEVLGDKFQTYGAANGQD